MSPFVLDLDTNQAICLGCGARIGNTSADKVEHLTTPSRARARQKHQHTTTATTTTETVRGTPPPSPRSRRKTAAPPGQPIDPMRWPTGTQPGRTR